jgi:hypothetical protein
MIQLIQNIQGNFVTEIKGNVTYVKVVEAEIQRDDYINIYGFTGFLQNLSQTPKTNGFAIPNLFGYSAPVGTYQQTLDFSTCNRTARWYNMQESPEYLMGLMCGVYPGSKTINFTIESFIVNGNEMVTTPLSASVNTMTANWKQANNNIIYSCTTGNATGWTYTDFVDFLNYTFNSYGLNYEARVSYKTIDLSGSNSVAGFYIIYPENDMFSLSTKSDSGFPMPMTYTNEGLSSLFISLGYYQTTLEYFNYDCETNTITE